jgi:hypothetical protein
MSDMAFQIKRKAVPQSVPVKPKAQFTASPLVQPPSNDPPPEYDFKEHVDQLDSPIVEGEVRTDLDEQLDNLHLENGHHDELPNPIIGIGTDEPQSIGKDGSSSASSKFKHALGEVKHFAGGLISHPYEATKHYSILRHSHGFVFYQGSATSIAVTVFSDQPLPIDRKLWLQKRGFSGKTGLKVGTLGSRSAWIDVTPSVEATADVIVAENERAWQRDIGKFTKKIRNTKNLCNHRPYETHIVRIPHVAEDAYFRIVLCSERKVLCPSPVFRYASSSLDPSVLRGASLSTLPLELAIRVGSMVAHTTANTAASGVLQPAVSAVQTAVQPYEYGGMTRWAATTAYDNVAADKVDSTVGSINEQYDDKRQLQATAAAEIDETEDSREVFLSREGPQPPYPIRFSGKIAPDAAEDGQANKVPSAKLIDVPKDMLLRLFGVYFGWISLSKTKATAENSTLNTYLEKWLQVIIVVSVQSGQNISVVEKKSAHIHIIDGLEDLMRYDVRASLMVMGYIRSSDNDLSSHFQRNIALVQEILCKEGWQPEVVLQKIKSASSTRSFTERIADARQSGQKQLDRLPVHRLGLRTDSMGLRDQLIGNGGICIKR